MTASGLTVGSGALTDVVIAASSTPVAGTYHLFKYVGADPFAGFNSTVTGPGSFTYTLVDNSGADEIDLQVTLTAVATIGTWISSADVNWNSTATGNWSDSQGTGVPGFSTPGGDQATFNGCPEPNSRLTSATPAPASPH